MAEPPEIFLVRHAQTEWSESRRHTGRTDIPLTEDGRENARTLGLRLRGREFARVLSSPLSRARETAQLAGFERAELREELLEWDYGDYEGLTTAEIRTSRSGWSLWRDGAPGGESPADVGRRLAPLLAELRQLAGDVIVFSHGHVLRALAALWIEMDAAGGAHLALDTGAVSALGWDRETPVLRLWNDAGRLPSGPADSG